MVVIRDRAHQQVVQVDASLSNAAPQTPLGACAWVAQAAHRIEACLQRSKSAAGLAADEGRPWMGWQQQQLLSFLATWFLVRKTQRGKTMAPGDDLTPDAPRHRDDRARGMAVWDDVA